MQSLRTISERIVRSRLDSVSRSPKTGFTGNTVCPPATDSSVENTFVSDGNPPERRCPHNWLWSR
ncbi:hypothetical protein C489_11620 [Natrinema versiforme JCM 10478]|uniref:Uncharacterized protein n=1 Tax=Natrinema versiforme JCM 10478 TaxID=1227496 RepID=L9XZA3_9EURY|nr:hypothetical protein C489_11620 [Natrinema versiforme JCM 10478]